MQPISLSRTGTGFITRPCNDPGKHFCAVFVIQRNVKHIPNGTAVKRWLRLVEQRAVFLLINGLMRLKSPIAEDYVLSLREVSINRQAQ